MPTEDLLTTLVKAIGDSASQHGSSNKPVARWAEMATIRIQTQGEQIKQLQDSLWNVMNNHGLSEGL